MKPITFRPTEDSLKALEAIKQARGCNQSQAINAGLIHTAMVLTNRTVASPDTVELCDLDAPLDGRVMEEEYQRVRAQVEAHRGLPTKLTRKAPKPGWKT